MDLYKRYALQEQLPLLGTAVAGSPSEVESKIDFHVPKQSTIPYGVPLPLTLAHAKPTEKTSEEWLKILPNAVFFQGQDPTLGILLVVVYENQKTSKMCTITVCKYGTAVYENLILDARLRFWPACQNLLPLHQKLNVRRAIAILILKHYLRFSQKYTPRSGVDETTAGPVASNMTLLDLQKPADLGWRLLDLGVVQTHRIPLFVVDVVYDNTSPDARPETHDENNQLVFMLGRQLQQLFDPLLEYLPEKLTAYRPPALAAGVVSRDLTIAKSVVDGLITVSTNYTMKLVLLLLDFIVPLRVNTLTTGGDISRINRIFPPTIDEVTRINCILLDLLVKASKISAAEVMRACAMILPHFYKPFIRHEANLKHFQKRLNRFHDKNSDIFSNPEINTGKYTPQTIESIVCGVLLELLKFKLILTRLNGALETTDSTGTVSENYQAAVQATDAFGDPLGKPDTEEAQKRVFTPTGKIFTEIASNWPHQLQHGWLVRKVVGIFELRRVGGSTEILVIFSDALLFIEVEVVTGKLSLSISDVLMHALANEKPLPQGIPPMRVCAWGNINDIIGSVFRGPTGDGLRFISVNTAMNDLCRTYELVLNTTAMAVLELINKARILNKSQDFHVFKSHGPLSFFYTAHELLPYSDETSKSPFVIFLNLLQQQCREMFLRNRNLFAMWNLLILTERQIHVEVHSRLGGLQASEIVGGDVLGEYIDSSISKYLSQYASLDNEILKSQLMNYLTGELDSFFQYANSNSVKCADQTVSSWDKGMHNNDTMVQMDPDVSPEREIKRPIAPVTPTKKRKSTWKAETVDNEEPHKKRKKGFFSRILGLLRKKLTKRKKEESARKEKSERGSMGPKENRKHDANTVRTGSRLSKVENTEIVDTNMEPELKNRSHRRSGDLTRILFETPISNCLDVPELLALTSIDSTKDIKTASQEIIPKVQHLYQPQPEISSQVLDLEVNTTPEVHAISVADPINEKSQTHEMEIDAGNSDFDTTARPFSIVGDYNVTENRHSFADQNIRTLDRVISHSYRDRLSKIIEKPLQLDTDYNWIPILSRENLSLLEAQIQALKQEANLETIEVLDVSSCVEDVEDKNSVKIEVVRHPSVKSVRSMTSKEVIENFEDLIDSQFHAMTVIEEENREKECAMANNGQTETNIAVPTARSRDFKVTKKDPSEFSIRERTNGEIATKWKPHEVTREQLLMELKKHEENSREMEKSASEAPATQDDSLLSFYTGDPYTEEEILTARAMAIYTKSPENELHQAMDGDLTHLSDNSEATMTNDIIDSKVEAQLPLSISYLSDLLEGTLKFDYDITPSTPLQMSHAINPQPLGPIAESPSLAYLGLYIYSGMTIKRDMNKIITERRAL